MTLTSRFMPVCLIATAFVISGCATTPSSKTEAPAAAAVKTEPPKAVHAPPPTPPASAPIPVTPPEPVPAPARPPAPVPPPPAVAPPPQAQTPAPAIAPEPPPVRKNTELSGNEVPHLKVVMACGICEAPDTVPNLIAQGYSRAASKSGKTVSSTVEATVAITVFTRRPPDARIKFGAFAGKDELKALVTYKNKKFEVEDSYSNALMGMNSLALHIGEMVLKKIRE